MTARLHGQAREPDDNGRDDFFDVVCVGGAVMGSSTAYWLTENPDFDGRVLVVEPDFSYDSAMTTRAQNSIREQFTNPLNIALSQFGIEFLANFHDNVQVDGVSPELNMRGTGYLFLADDEAAYGALEAEAVGQRAMGAGVTMLRPEALAAQFPYMDHTQVAGARMGSLKEGSFDGWGLFQGIRQRAIANGATFLKDRVVGIDRQAARVTAVRLESGKTIGCDWVVNTSGCRASEVAAMAGLPLPVEPRSRTSFVFDCRTPIPYNVPLTITPAGVHFRREQNHYMCGAVPVNDVAVDPADLAARNDEFDELIWPVLARYVPQFDKVKVVTSWGGQYDYNTLDHNVIVGAGNEIDNFLFASGFSGHGLQQGPAIGRGLSELITYGSFRTIDLTPLSYQRIESGTPFLESAVI